MYGYMATGHRWPWSFIFITCLYISFIFLICTTKSVYFLLLLFIFGTLFSIILRALLVKLFTFVRKKILQVSYSMSTSCEVV